jgi:hypothetical protein
MKIVEETAMRQRPIMRSGLLKPIAIAFLFFFGASAAIAGDPPATEAADFPVETVAPEELILDPCELEDDVEACMQAASADVATRSLPLIRSLTAAEIAVARQVFQNTINYGMVKVTNTTGAGGRPWTTNTPPIYLVNVGSLYSSLSSSASRRTLLIHELAHVWQGQHLVPFMINSLAHQTLSFIANGGDVAPAYTYTPGLPWGQYNAEQQASIVTHWYTGGMSTTDARYRYIRDNIRMKRAF